MGSTLGAILGVSVWKLLDMGVTNVIPLLADVFPSGGMLLYASLGAIIYALVIIVFVVVEPRGMAHRWELLKVSYRLHPFSY